MDQCGLLDKLARWIGLAGLMLCVWGSFAEASQKLLFPYIVQLPENENAIVVEKKTQQLFIFKNSKNEWEKQMQVPCSTGEVGGVKLRAGDKKTPEGIYFIKDEYEDKYLTPVYGKRAFPIDYPNLLDIRDGKNGSAIWIHGTNKELKPMDSNGCIALENENVVKLSDYVTIDSTPVILVESIVSTATPLMLANQKKQIRALVDTWSLTLNEGTYQEYLSFYSPSYLPDIGFWRDWINIRKQLSDQGKIVEFINNNLGIYYHNNIFVVVFDQGVAISNKHTHLGKRKLFLSKTENEYVIIGDEYQSVPNKLKTKSAPLVSAMQMLVAPQLFDDQMVSIVKQWLEAWSNKKMENYASFYSDNFFSDGMNKKKWVARKKKIAKQYDYINVTGKDFQVTFDKDHCNVRFSQSYRSSAFIAKGIKLLKLENIGGSWKIFQESWKRK